MIKHTVFFSLKHAEGSEAEQAFFRSGAELAAIPGVRDFRRVKQVSRKNDFAYGFLMGFDDEGAYRAYSEHPAHVAFVRDHWIPEVARFLEIDYLE